MIASFFIVGAGDLKPEAGAESASEKCDSTNIWCVAEVSGY